MEDPNIKYINHPLLTAMGISTYSMIVDYK